jgi:hypothetical protein
VRREHTRRERKKGAHKKQGKEGKKTRRRGAKEGRGGVARACKKENRDSGEQRALYDD